MRNRRLSDIGNERFLKSSFEEMKEGARIADEINKVNIQFARELNRAGMEEARQFGK